MALRYVEAALRQFSGMLPSGKQSDEFQVPPDCITDHFLATCNENMFLDAWLIPNVCQNPERIWRGLGRVGMDNQFVYSGHPTCAFAEHYGQEDVELVEGFTFTVFLTSDFEVTKYRWSEEDADDSGYPINYSRRFGEQLWPKR